MPRSVAVIVGSLRKDSFTRKLAHVIAELAAPALVMQQVDIGHLPHYNPDLDTEDAPAEWRQFRERIRAADAVLFVTPEYNRSVPGTLKNAIDVGSRPYGKSAWSRKPAAIASASPGGLGAFGANHHLRQSLVFLDMPTLQQPELYIGGINKLLDADGKLVNDDTRALLGKFAAAFAEWIERHPKA